MEVKMLEEDNAVLVLVDVQEKLFAVTHDRETLLKNLETLIRGMQALEVPIIWMEQIPEKMGPSIPEIRNMLKHNIQPISKTSFSCYLEPEFGKTLTESGRKQVLLAGIETHVCVYQTAADLVKYGYHVEVLEDCTSSRTESNRNTGLKKIQNTGAGLTSVETLLFEMMKDSTHPAFRDILKIVK